MAIGKDVGLDHDRFAYNALGGNVTAVNFRANSFNDNANPPFRWEHSFSPAHALPNRPESSLKHNGIERH